MTAPGQEDLRSFLERKENVLVLDGALATELEARGCNLHDRLWSGKVLLESPELIQAVEASYLDAGARCLITASYQVTPQALQEQRGMDEAAATAVVAGSVRVAKAARAAFRLANPHVVEPIFVAGSVGPYGAYLADGSEYRGDYRRTMEEHQAFHRPRITALVTENVDVLAVETQPSADEVRAIVRLLEREFPGTPCWVSFTIREPSVPGAPVTHIADGTPLVDIARELEMSPSVVALGFNCISLRAATPALQSLSQIVTSKPLVIYPNSGEVYDAVSKTWRKDSDLPHDAATLSANVDAWLRAGARLVGGCCRTGPADIANLRKEIGTVP